MLIIFFGIKGTDHKEFVLAGQTVNSAYYCEVLRRLRANVRRLRPELWRQKNWLLHHDNSVSHFLSHQGISDKETTWLSSHTYSTFLFPRLEARHFDTIEVVEAESQAVLNSLTEHDFQDAFKHGRSAGNGAYTRKGTTSTVKVASRATVSV
jgi:hypothetical protein